MLAKFTGKLHSIPVILTEVEIMSEQKLPVAYTGLLKKVRQAKNEGIKIGEEYWIKLHRELIEVENLTAAESKLVVEALQRDLNEAKHILRDIGTAIADWLSFDAAVLEDKFEDWIALVADDTEVDWLLLGKQWNEMNQYHTGDLIGIGVLECTKCGQLLHFQTPGHVPPCPHCHHTDFNRTPQH